MMDPASIPQGADSIPRTACVDAKRLWCSAMADNPVSKVLDDDYTSSWPAPVPPLDDENLLQEILLRLPSKPSSLLRASLVCKHWRIILSDPKFLKRFRKHHQKPPLLGFFAGNVVTTYVFTPVLDSPDRIPAVRFSMPRSRSPCGYWDFLGCRHGLAVLINDYQRAVVVWDPLTGQQRRAPLLPWLCNAKMENSLLYHAAVLCADAEDGHVHGDCFSSPFRLVLILGGSMKVFACLYESACGVWGNIASTTSTDTILRIRPNILIGNVVYWLFYEGDILAFDIKRQTLDVIEKPADIHHTDCWSFQLLQTDDDSGLHLAVMSKLSIQLWKRKSSSDDVVGWVLLEKIIQLEGLLPPTMLSYHKKMVMVGYDEESNVIVLNTYIGDFMLQLESLQFRRISESRNCWDSYKIHYPYRNFYTAGITSVSRV